jgi:hypothetical protein
MAPAFTTYFCDKKGGPLSFCQSYYIRKKLSIHSARFWQNGDKFPFANHFLRQKTKDGNVGTKRRTGSSKPVKGKE